MSKNCWHCIENIRYIVPLPYPITSLAFSIFIYLIYYFLSLKVEYLIGININATRVSIISILISYQLIGIIYILNNLKEVFRDIPNTFNEASNNVFYNFIYSKIDDDYYYYMILLFIISPFFSLFILRILSKEQNFFFLLNNSIWSYFLDLFNNIIPYLTITLLGVVFWIAFITTKTINELEKSYFREILRIDLFNSDGFGGLKPLRNLMLKMIIYYFGCISISIIYFIPSKQFLEQPLPIELWVLILLLIFGILFFFTGMQSIERLLSKKLSCKITEINEKYDRLQSKLLKISSINGESYIIDELEWTSKALQSLHAEREKLINTHRRVDFVAILTFSSSISLSIFTLIEKLWGLAD